MLDPFTRTRFHSGLRLETWYPEGVLDSVMLSFMASFLYSEERLSDEPFHRFSDLSELTAIQLTFVELASFALERRVSYDGGPPVKSAILAPDKATYAIARMFALLMDPSPIDVKVFRTVEDAAEWLEVPAEALQI